MVGNFQRSEYLWKQAISKYQAYHTHKSATVHSDISISNSVFLVHIICEKSLKILNE